MKSRKITRFGGKTKMRSCSCEKLRTENKALKETCEILADKKLMQDIRTSLEQIRSLTYNDKFWGKKHGK